MVLLFCRFTILVVCLSFYPGRYVLFWRRYPLRDCRHSTRQGGPPGTQACRKETKSLDGAKRKEGSNVSEKGDGRGRESSGTTFRKTTEKM